MTPFTLNEIARVRYLRLRRFTMADLVQCLSPHTRDEVVEAIDATIRYQRDAAARDHVNRVLDLQSSGIHLINGWPQHEVATRWGHGLYRRYDPMF